MRYFSTNSRGNNAILFYQLDGLKPLIPEDFCLPGWDGPMSKGTFRLYISRLQAVVGFASWSRTFVHDICRQNTFDCHSVGATIKKLNIHSPPYHSPPSLFSRARLFHVQKNDGFPSILMIFNDFYHFWAHGPYGPWDPSFFEFFGKLILWSGSCLEVFVWCLGPQGTP